MKHVCEPNVVIITKISELDEFINSPSVYV